MNEKNINKSSSFSRVLIAPLDWGLGHATRCIPIIHALLKENITVFIAAEGAILNLFQKEFHNVTILPLRGYNISYPAEKKSLFAKLLQQVPGVLSVIRYENKWLEKMIREHSIDAVISDNRFGMHSRLVKSIYITHQLHIETNHSFFNWLAQKIHYRYINRYDACWVPDAEGVTNLAGKLSHPEKLPAIPVKYLGALSRFKKIIPKKKHDLLILLSGPEPQRSYFEDILLQQLKGLEIPVVFVRGLPTATSLPEINRNTVFYNHLPAEELSALVQQSKMVVCRSGYSTVMDLACVQQKAILVPTPGQTEQEYLAGYLQEKKMFLTYKQGNFNLKKALEAAEEFDYAISDFSENLQDGITTFVKGLQPDVPR
ncbi:glycosyltransferase [Ferruginibacter sp. HRS2-29]|uniref:glycosyltransferase n=1 Tax=Ferruginibacter sp. HRS2-29 TaxID=2487334 RepID=UPI0020CF62D3|nr:glycosyltransferase [Ferruginibacter sp. HRS2-29]MCP9749560.1 glycosyl transferase family 28 [Ferruginibacter sp. HRS2-29]